MNIYKQQCIDITTNIHFFHRIIDVWLFMKGAQRGKTNQTKKKENERENLEQKRGKKKEIGDEYKN